MSETRRYLARQVTSRDTRSFDVIDTADDDRAVLATIPGAITIDVVEAMNASYEQAASEGRQIAKEAVDLLCMIGFSGLDRTKQRELWQRGLDLDCRLNPGRARTIVWTPGEGDVDPPRREDGSPLPILELH